MPCSHHICLLLPRSGWVLTRPPRHDRRNFFSGPGIFRNLVMVHVSTLSAKPQTIPANIAVKKSSL